MIGSAFLCHDRAFREPLASAVYQQSDYPREAGVFQRIRRGRIGGDRILAYLHRRLHTLDKCSLFAEKLQNSSGGPRFGGICAAIKLRIAGYSNFLVIERAQGLSFENINQAVEDCEHGLAQKPIVRMRH
jgi:hypothetical protein